MIAYTTRNSVFEVDPDARRVRRVSGVNPPTEHFAPDGDWKVCTDATEVEHPAGGAVLVVTWPDGSYTMTSRVSRVEYRPEPFDPSPEPFLCERVLRPASWYDPAEFCDEEAEPGSEFCPEHNPDRALDDAEGRRD